MDENGRRRFHGAFTGGFSAGFWNTVGSLEGWKPQEFKSSRQEKATRKRQCVDDFMDEEDKGQFGIAPQRVQAKEDYTNQDSLNNKKQKMSTATAGPIPGVPVLQSLLKPSRDNIATRLLKQMGWREGQGIGARQTKTQKKRAQSRNEKELYIMAKYGCELGQDGPSTSRAVPTGVEEEESESDEEITFAPDDFDPFLATVKENTFGYGYSGLDRNPVLGGKQRFNLFQPLEILDKNNKKLSISGQAFGVGAFEAEDDDIYERDDMTKYDFSLEEKRRKKEKKEVLAIQQGALDGFEAPQSRERGKYKNKVYKVGLPKDYEPRNWTERRSRFDRLPEDMEMELSQQNSYKLKGLGRHDLNPEQRSALLNEPGPSPKLIDVSVPPPEITKEAAPKNKFLELINKKYESFEKSAEIVNPNVVDQEATKSLEEAKKKTFGMPMIQASGRKFKPFPQDLEKQKRYDKFCEFPLSSDAETTAFLATIQPVNLSQWDREMEKKEFIQARKLFRPLDGLMLNRFVTETELNEQRTKEEEAHKKTTAAEDKPTAVQVGGKKEVHMKRVKAMWKPNTLLCKRFNVPEPFGGAIAEEKPKHTKSKYGVFDYLEVSVNKKEAFITPIVRPEKTRQAMDEEEAQKRQQDLKTEETNATANSDGRLSTKELFERELSKSIAAATTTAVSTTSTSATVQSVPNKSRERVKTELEQKSIALKDTHPAEKKDLFKAIFDSSDSEEEEEKEGDTKRLESVPKPDISALLKKSANEINILRNNSPPRGIFANLYKKPLVEEKLPPKETIVVAEKATEVPSSVDKNNTSNAPPKILFRRKEERVTIRKHESDEDAEEEQCFGPKPPPPPKQGSGPSKPLSLFDKLPGQSQDKLDRKLAEALQGQDMKIVEEWIEKDKLSSSSSKKKKSKDKERDKEGDKDKKKHKKDKKHKKEKRHKDRK